MPKLLERPSLRNCGVVDSDAEESTAERRAAGLMQRTPQSQPLMRRDEIRIGTILRVTRKRWDVPAGTFARVEEVDQAGVPPSWCFRCECLFMDGLVRRSTSSLNLFEEDLVDFEPFTGPIPIPPAPQSKRSRGILPKIPSPQLSLPYTANDFISERLDLDGFPLAADPVWDFNVDV